MRPEPNAAKYSPSMPHPSLHAVQKRLLSFVAVIALVVASLALGAPAFAKAPRLQPCPDQEYDLAGDVLGLSGVTLAVQGRLIALSGICDARRGTVKATKKGTRLQVEVAELRRRRARSGCRAASTPTCETVTVTVRARGRGRGSKVTGTRHVEPPPTTVPTTTLPTTTGPSLHHHDHDWPGRSHDHDDTSPELHRAGDAPGDRGGRRRAPRMSWTDHTDRASLRRAGWAGR